MKYLKAIAVFLLSLLPVSCHYKFTSAALYAHQSSAAFDTWVLFWFLGLLAALVGAFAALDMIAARSHTTKG